MEYCVAAALLLRYSDIGYSDIGHAVCLGHVCVDHASELYNSSLVRVCSMPCKLNYLLRHSMEYCIAAALLLRYSDIGHGTGWRGLLGYRYLAEGILA